MKVHPLVPALAFSVAAWLLFIIEVIVVMTLR